MPYWRDALVPGELDGSLCRSQTGNRHTVGRAGYIVESNLVAELYRSGIAAMLTADAQFEVRLHRAAQFGGTLNELAYTPEIQGSKGSKSKIFLS